MRRRWSALAVLGTAIASLLLASAPSAGAHAYLATSNPTDGGSLTIAPAQLELGFSESIVLGATSLELRDSRGVRYPVSGLRLQSSSPDGDTEEPATLFATLPKLPRSAYRLSWATLSRDDLHRTSGVIVFGVGQPVTAAGAREPWPSWFEVGMRWLMFCGIAVAFGGLLAIRLNGRHGGQGRSGYRWAGAAALLTAAAAAVLLMVQGRSVGVGTVLAGRYGDGWIGREVGLLILAAICLIRSHRKAVAPRAIFLLSGLAIVDIAMGSALVGHNSVGGLSYLIVDAIHLAATATWTGCPIVLVLLSRRVSMTPYRSALVAFAGPAAVLVTVTVASGVYLASSVVVSVDAAVSTIYGRVLLIKICLFGVGSIVGLINFIRLRRPRASSVRRTIVVEALVTVVVIGLAAILTSSQPAREPGFVRTNATASTSVDRTVADLEQIVSVKPNLPGRNLVVLGLFERRRPAPGQISQVRIQITDAGGVVGAPVVAQALADGNWSAPVDLPSTASVSIRTNVLRVGLAPVTSDVGWTIRRPAGATRNRVISQVPIRSRLQTLAGVLLGGFLLSAGLAAARRTRRHRSGRPRPIVTGPATVTVPDRLEPSRSG